MICCFAGMKIFSFWPKTIDYIIVKLLIRFLYALLTPHCKVLGSQSLRHSVALEMPSLDKVCTQV